MTPDEAMGVLSAAGWHARRKVETTRWLNQLHEHGIGTFDTAERFLAEFGGIEIAQGGTGINIARTRFVIDPSTAAWLGKFIHEFEVDGLGPFCPVGEAGHGGEGTLVIDPGGEIFMLCEDGIGRVAIDFGAGMDAVLNLIRGYLERRIRIDEDYDA